MRISSKRATNVKTQIGTLNKAREQIEVYLESCVRTLENESRANHDRFSGIPAISEQDLPISVCQKHEIELKRCPLDRARRALLGK